MILNYLYNKWRYTQIGEEDGLENRQVGDESAWGFESLYLRINSIVMVKGYFDLLAHLVERKTINFDVIGSIPI